MPSGMFLHDFAPSFETIDHVDALPLQRELQNEQPMYQASMAFAHEQGGPITRAFIEKLPFKLSDNVLVDIRVHSLQKGYYPAIPGYHLDWLPRTKDGENPVIDVIPDYDHVVMILAETSLTEFVAEPLSLLLPEEKPFEWANDEIKRWTSVGKLDTKHVVNGDMVRFTSRDWHRPVAAEKNEWRFLIRASRIDHRKPSNKLVNQSQVYIPIKEASW